MRAGGGLSPPGWGGGGVGDAGGNGSGGGDGSGGVGCLFFHRGRFWRAGGGLNLEHGCCVVCSKEHVLQCAALIKEAGGRSGTRATGDRQRGTQPTASRQARSEAWRESWTSADSQSQGGGQGWSWSGSSQWEQAGGSWEGGEDAESEKSVTDGAAWWSAGKWGYPK